MAAEIREQFALASCLDTFGDDGEIEGAAQSDKYLNNTRMYLAVVADTAEEAIIRSVPQLVKACSATDGTIQAIAGWMSPKIIERYSHVRNEAKRAAVAVWTLVRLQYLKTQAEEMRLEREAMKRQADLMEQQANEARESAAQATAIAKQSADAASLNAAAQVSSERAWVQVEVVGDKYWVEQPSGSSKMWFRPLIKNFGRTPATIEFIVVRPHFIPADERFPDPPQLPPEPEYASPQSALTDQRAFLPPAMGINLLAVAIDEADFEAMKKGEKFLYVYGQILYRDITGEGRTSNFCNLYWIPPFEAHPAPEGFTTPGDTPAAYTEYT